MSVFHRCNLISNSSAKKNIPETYPLSSAAIFLRLLFPTCCQLYPFSSPHQRDGEPAPISPPRPLLIIHLPLLFFCPRLFPPPLLPCLFRLRGPALGSLPTISLPPSRQAGGGKRNPFLPRQKKDISENPRAWLGERLEGGRRVSFGLHSIYPCSFGSKIEKPEKDQTLHRFPPFALVERESPDGLLPPHFSEEQALRSELGKPRGGTFSSTWRSGQECNFICGDVICWPFHATPPSLSSWKNLSKGAANNFLKKRLPNQGRKGEWGAFPRLPRLSSSPTPLILPHKEKVPLTDPLVSPLPLLPPRRPN